MLFRSVKNCFASASTSAGVSVVRNSWSVRWDWFMTGCQDECGTPTGGAKRRREEQSGIWTCLTPTGGAKRRREEQSQDVPGSGRAMRDAARVRILTEREGERGVREPLRLPGLQRQLDPE